MASLYNLLSASEVFGLTRAQAQAIVVKLEQVGQTWRDIFAKRRVAQRSVERFAQAFLPDCFYRTQPPDEVV